MSIEKNKFRYKKIKSLYMDWPKNAIITSSSLKKHGFSDQLIQKYCASGWLIRVGGGAFVRYSEHPTLEGALYAIQFELKKPIHVGGLTALQIHGLAHYLELSSKKETTYITQRTTNIICQVGFNISAKNKLFIMCNLIFSQKN